MTPLEHSDHILTARSGEWLMACDTVSGVNMDAGGRIHYGPGARFRVKFACGGLVWCLDENARSVSFGREDMAALERAP